MTSAKLASERKIGGEPTLSSKSEVAQMASILYSVVIPTYNERQNIAILVYWIEKTMRNRNLQFEIVIVDDGSPDGTQEVVKELQKHYGEDKIRLCPRPCKMGLGSAYMHGLNFTRGDFVFLMDADLSHHPKYMTQFVSKQEATGADIVTGSRYMPGGGVGGWDLRRKMTSRGANVLAHTLLWPKTSDLTGSFRLYKTGVLKELLKSVQSKGYVFQMEIIVRAEKADYRIEEVPITFVDRMYGSSKLGGSEIVQYVEGLLWLFLTV